MTTPSEPTVEGPIAPTVTMNWLKCPTLGALSQAWEPVGNWTPNRLLGIAIGKGLDALLSGVSLDDGDNNAEIIVERTITEGFEEQDEWPLDAVVKLGIKGLRAAEKETVQQILASEKVLHTELDVGGGKVDLVSQRDLIITDHPPSKGTLFTEVIITDHKVRLSLKPEWVNPELLQSEADWQLWDYAARITAYLGRPVGVIRRHLIVLSPKTKAFLHEHQITPTQIENWQRGAEHEWWYIRELRKLPLTELPLRTTGCFSKFGKCSFYEACWQFDRDPEQMKVLYNKKQ